MKTDKTEPGCLNHGCLKIISDLNAYKIGSGWWNQEWCPLFGALPSCELRDSVSEECLNVITSARRILDTNMHVSSMIKNPDPEIIEKNTGYPASIIDGARFLVHCCSAHDIIFDAQFHQGLYCDINQLDIANLSDAIRIRAGLPHEFMCALTDNPNDLTKEDWKDPIITPIMTFALMSIAVAWYTFKHTSDGSIKPESREAIDDLLSAQKLLHRAEEQRADESIQRINQIKQEPIINGRAGGLASKITRGDKAHARNADLQKRADELWETHPDYSKKSIANLIAGEAGIRMDTIRRNIQKK